MLIDLLWFQWWIDKGNARDVMGEEITRIPPYQFKLNHYDEFERVCGVKSKRREEKRSSQKREREDVDEKVIFETKRYRLSTFRKAEKPKVTEKKSKGCVIF